jgi:hypothetical protein
MPKGLPELKNRNARSRELYHIRRRHQATCLKLAAAEAALKNIMRQDLESGEVTKMNRSSLNSEIAREFPRMMSLNPNEARYASPERVVWEQLERGAVYFGVKAIYWIENLVVTH